MSSGKYISIIVLVIAALITGAVIANKNSQSAYDALPIVSTPEETPTHTSAVISDTTSWSQLSFNPSSDSKETTILENTFKTLASVFTPSQPIYSPASETRYASNPGVSDATYFKEAYPDYFIATLREWQTLVMNNSSLITTPHTFSSEADVLSFYETFLDFLASKGHLSASDVEAAKESVRTDFRSAKDKERLLMSAIPTPRDPLAWAKRITAWFLPDQAFAALWQSAPLCYKQIGPAGKSTALVAPTCNSGATANGAPIPDCGPQGAACVAPFGCLNAVCRLGNAIWDPRTKICGCDTGAPSTAVASAFKNAAVSAAQTAAQAPTQTTDNAKDSGVPTTNTQASNPGRCPSGGAAANTLKSQVTTNYYPIAGADASEGMEGGDATSRKGPDGEYKPRTLEDFRNGKSNYISIASDPSMYGKSYIIPEVTYAAYDKDASGNFIKDSSGKYQISKHTLYNVPAYVHDTGSYFTGRPDKFDMATQVLPKGMGLSTSKLDNSQPSHADVSFVPASGVGTNAAVCD